VFLEVFILKQAFIFERKYIDRFFDVFTGIKIILAERND
jgi:hypothetical protein